MDAQIVKRTQDLSTASEMRQMTQMLMQPNANWEEYLTPAPLSIAIMGELVFISSGTDFSINPKKTSKKSSESTSEDPPAVELTHKFQYIKYPDSFKASLMQVCNLGWHAFNVAHKNMDQIRIHTATVPGYMKAAVKILFHGTDEVIETLLPNQLENIRTIAEDCVTLAKGVESRYSDVINLIQELLEACLSARHIYEEQLEEVQMKLKETERKKESAEQMNELAKKAMDTMSKQLQEAQDGFKKSMDSMPSGWDMIGMDFVEGFSSAVTGLLNGFANKFSDSSSAAETPCGSNNQEQQNSSGNNDVLAPIEVYCKSGEIMSCVENLNSLLNENGIDFEKLYNKAKKSTDEKVKFEQSTLQNLYKNLSTKSDCGPKNEALCLCQRGIDIYEKLVEYEPSEVWEKKETNKIVQNVRKLDEDAKRFDCKSKKALGVPALYAKPPMRYKANNSSQGRQSASQRAAENARFNIEQSQEQLKQAREAHEKCMERMQKSQKELTDILVEMQNCEIKEINFQTTIKMLVKGLEAMGRVKEQWEKMVRFFQMVSNIIKASLEKTLINFVNTVENTKNLSYNGKLFAKDLLYSQAFQASNIASLVHMISTTYTEVSNKYLMDRVSSLGKLMAMDKENPEFESERLKLQISCKEAQDGILHLAQKNKEEFERKTKTRMATIESQLKAILPAASAQETERNKEIIKAGFVEGEENYY